jgi:hypothetical protein
MQTFDVQYEPYVHCWGALQSTSYSTEYTGSVCSVQCTVLCTVYWNSTQSVHYTVHCVLMDIVQSTLYEYATELECAIAASASVASVRYTIQRTGYRSQIPVQCTICIVHYKQAIAFCTRC